MADFSKQGIIIIKNEVYKKHKTLNDANLEVNITKLYSENGMKEINTLKQEIVTRDKEIFIKMPFIEGVSARDTNNIKLLEELVFDLSIFHELFAKEKNSPKVIYRDAILSNYICENENKYTHIDFSSSNKYVHCFDDLALLLNPLWHNLEKTKIPSLVEKYIENRHIISNKINRKEIKNIKNETKEEIKKYYILQIKNMEIEGFYNNQLKKKINEINYDIIKKQDFKKFLDYRTLRGKMYLETWRKNKI